MRPQPIEPIAGAPSFVAGVAIIRGQPVPVLDAGLLLEGRALTAPTRLVTLRVDGRVVALAVDAVIGVRAVDPDALDAMPAVLARASADVIEALGAVDGELLATLRTARLVPDAVWAAPELEAPR